VRNALVLAAREGVVSLDGSQIRFTHPLLASVCYERAQLWDRRAAHRSLARAVSDLEEQARHLALAAEAPDAAVAAELDAAAARAAARGATASSAELFELAAELTPPENTADSRRRRLHAGRSYLLAGSNERGTAILEQLLEETPPGVERVDVLLALVSTVLLLDSSTAISRLREALVEEEIDDARSAQIQGALAMYRWSQNDVPGALADARAALEKAERVGDDATLARSIAQVALVETWTLEITPDLLERGMAIEERLEWPFPFWQSPTALLGNRLLQLDDVDRARTVYKTVERKAVARGDEGTRAVVFSHLIYLETRAGRLPQALEQAAAARELAEEAQDDMVRLVAATFEALVEAQLGHIEQARAKAEEGLAIARALEVEMFTLVNRSILGHLELALGNLEAAGRYLRELPSRLLSLGWNGSSGATWPDSIETLLALGEVEQARAYLAQYEELAERHSRLSQACATRCRGLLAAAEGDLDAAFEAFERALAEHEGLSIPLERGRTLLALGTVRRQARQKRLAREALEQSLAIFEELGARLWAEKARAELRRISGRRPASAELTETEQRVATLAAEGRSNKEIAAALFMSVHTVEAHLTHIYAKLDVHSRVKLAQRLATTPQGEPKRAEPAAKE
jgi:DNA-binding CsgD family transcriptional regulator